MFHDPPSAKAAILAYLITVGVIGAVAWAGAHFQFLWPAPLMMVLPAWLLGETLLGDIDAGPKLIPLIGALPFILIGIPLLLPHSRVMWPTALLCVALAIGSATYFATSWNRGVEFQGIAFTTGAALVNFLITAGCFWLTWRGRRSGLYSHRYLAAVVPCLWLVWGAFPWLGEMP
jgi:hypothetical protein